MSQWNWKRDRSKGMWRTGPGWLAPFLAVVPWLTVVLLVLMIYMVGGTLASAEGLLFDLPDSTGIVDGESAPLVALVMSKQRETLVFFDDGRYTLGDEVSAAAFGEHLGDRASKVERKTLLVLADRRVASGELMKLSGIVRRSGIKRVLFAEKRAGKEDE